MACQSPFTPAILTMLNHIHSFQVGKSFFLQIYIYSTHRKLCPRHRHYHRHHRSTTDRPATQEDCKLYCCLPKQFTRCGDRNSRNNRARKVENLFSLRNPRDFYLTLVKNRFNFKVNSVNQLQPQLGWWGSSLLLLCLCVCWK